MNKVTLHLRNNFNQFKQTVELVADEKGNFTLHSDGEETKNFTLLYGVNEIVEMAIQSDTDIRVEAYGPMSEQAQCNMQVGSLPLGTISNQLPLVTGQVVLTFEVETARSGGQPSTLKMKKYLGVIDAIDAREY